MNAESAILFDEESPDRPHLDHQLAQKRKLVEMLRDELKSEWKRFDEWREIRRRNA